MTEQTHMDLIAHRAAVANAADKPLSFNTLQEMKERFSDAQTALAKLGEGYANTGR